MAAALDRLLLKPQELEPAVAGQLVRAAHPSSPSEQPHLLAFPGRAAMLFEGLGRFGVAPDDLASGIASYPWFAIMEKWAYSRPTAEMLDHLLRGAMAAWQRC